MREGKKVLQQIGEVLDRDACPRVWDGGFVAPEGHVVRVNPSGEVNEYDEQERRQGESGSSAGPGTGPSGGEGPPGGPRQTGEAPPAVLGDLEAAYLGQLDRVNGAYPGLRTWTASGGLWLLARAGLVAGLDYRAQFLVIVPFVRLMPKAWGFWADGSWIGPRHTNFPDGSICALHGPDATWLPGDDLVALIDLYALWAVCHLHVREFGYWPGRQVATLIHERLSEISDDEMCGCGSSKSYAMCCKDDDLAHSKISAAIDFALKTRGPRRQVPQNIWRFMTGASGPPPLQELMFQP